MMGQSGEEPRSAAGLALAPLPDLLGYRLHRAHAALFARFRERFLDLEMRPALLGILTVVANNPGLRQADLSDALGIAPTNLVPLLGELERRALLDRGPAPSDRRSRSLTLTAAGQHLLQECQQREAALEAALAARIGPAACGALLNLLADVEQACREI